MGGCQNYGPFLGTLNIRGHIIIGTQKGTIIWTTTQMDLLEPICWAVENESEVLEANQASCSQFKVYFWSQ